MCYRHIFLNHNQDQNPHEQWDKCVNNFVVLSLSGIWLITPPALFAHQSHSSCKEPDLYLWYLFVIRQHTNLYLYLWYIFVICQHKIQIYIRATQTATTDLQTQHFLTKNRFFKPFWGFYVFNCIFSIQIRGQTRQYEHHDFTTTKTWLKL